MRSKIVLHIEDAAENVASFDDAVSDWNHAHRGMDRTFKIMVANDQAKALQLLDEIKIDCALVDLRLPESEGLRETADAGNDLVSDMSSNYGVPLGIISGHPAELSDRNSNTELIKVFDKGDSDSYEKAVNWLAELWDMMEAIHLARRQLDAAAAPVFAKRIWPQWSSISAIADGDIEQLSTVISRQYASHTAEMLGLDNETSWHPYEHYVVPPFLENRPHTGDLFLLDKEYWIILTPQCDMANGKVKNVVLAKCEEGLDDWEKHTANILGGASNTSKSKADKFLKKYVSQNISQSEHFLPPLPGRTHPLVVQFSGLTTISLKILRASLDNRVASIAPPFLSNLIQRFGAAMSRTGQPDLDVKHFAAGK